MYFQRAVRTAALGRAMAVAPRAVQRARLGKAWMALLLPTLWRWDELKAFWQGLNAAHAPEQRPPPPRAPWPLPTTKAAGFAQFAAAYNASGAAGLVNVNFSPCGVLGWGHGACVYDCALRWLHGCLFETHRACPPTGKPLPPPAWLAATAAAKAAGQAPP